jgi:hypothetical protein
MEVSLSFDNAVVNASVLRHWNEFWRKLFLTVGILIAVFGMRLVFPLLIVSMATGLGLIDVWHMATTTPEEYSRHLTGAHAEVAAFGGAFLLLVFLNFLFDDQKELHWLGWMEKKLGQHGTESLSVLLALAAVFGCVALVAEDEQYSADRRRGRRDRLPGGGLDQQPAGRRGAGRRGRHHRSRRRPGGGDGGQGQLRRLPVPGSAGRLVQL